MSAGGRGVNTGALARSLRAMTIGTVESHQRAHDQYEADSLGELDLQFQIPVSGQATPSGAWVELSLEFEAPFIDAYDERESPYSDPLFTVGYVQTRGEPAFLMASVKAWHMSDGMYVGATLQIGAFRPDGSGPFTGEVHANFQGYGTPHPDSDTGESAA